MNYKVIERKDPRNPEAPGKYYGFIVNLSKIGIEEIATRISGTCTVLGRCPSGNDVAYRA